MALSDWQLNYLAFPGNMTIAYEVITPLVGTGSLKFVYTNTSVGTVDLSAKVGAIPGETFALSHGRIRTLIRPFFTVSTGFCQGIHFMTSQSYLAGGTGSCYFVNVNGAALNFQVRKVTSTGLANPGITTLGSGGSWVAATTIPLEVEWHSDIPNLGGTFITLRRGTLLDFSDLSPIITLLDTTSPFSVSSGEGLYVSNLASANGNVLFDDTRVTRLIPT